MGMAGSAWSQESKVHMQIAVPKVGVRPGGYQQLQLQISNIQTGLEVVGELDVLPVWK